MKLWRKGGGITALLALLLLGCAEVLPPPGGPEDRSGPAIIGSEPAHGAVGIDSLEQITIYFSEKVDKPRTGSGILVSPRQEEEPNVDWHSDRVEIRLSDSLLPDRTYMFAIQSGVRDYRGNPLDSNAVVAFSTGETIDSGRIAGRVVRGDRPAPGVSVALYEIELETETPEYDSLFPAYLTETTRDGGFELQFLAERRYRLIAFNDRNDDSRFNPAREPYAIPDRPIVIGGVLPLDELTLLMTATDTVKPAIIGTNITTDNLVQVRLSTTIDPSYLIDNPGGARLVAHTDDSTAVPANAVREARDDTTATLHLACGSISEGLYRILITYDTAEAPLEFDSLQVRGMSADETGPALLTTLPREGTYFIDDVDIRLQFSEPIDSTKLSDETFGLAGADSVPQPLGYEQLDPFWLRLVPQQLAGGVTYNVIISEFDIADQSGNLLGDSLREFSFTTLNPDSLGSISGEVTILLPDRTEQTVIVTADQVGSEMSFEQSTADGSFNIEVPGGRYILRGFVDSDGNGQPSAGSIDPFRLAEPVATMPDTVRVRPRFETSGNQLIIR